MQPHDFIAVGDTVTDEFIKLKDARVNCTIDNESCELCVRFGDKVPYESVETVHAVGNAANAAVAATRLGLATAFVSDVGGDELGEKILEALAMQGVSTSFITVHEDMRSNHHYVLQYEAERTILVKHQPYPYRLPDVGEPKWIYLSSLAENSLPYQHAVAEYVTKHPNTKLVFQPGTFQIKLGKDELRDVYAASYLFFCNKDEARRVLNSTSDSVRELSEALAALGPKIICITDGPAGAYAYESATGDLWKISMYPDSKPPIDRTGAGDAFASTFTVALALGKSVPEALAWGPINSMSVVQYIGAQKGLLTQENLEKLLAEAPAGYKAEKV